MSRRVHMAEVMGDAAAAATATPLPLPPPSPPRPPTLVGPDKWWNPFAPAFPPNALGRAAGDAIRKKTAEVAQETEERLEQKVAELEQNTPGIDPIVVAETIVGKPTWGYYFPTVAIGVGSAAAILGVGALALRARNRRKKKKS